jgi:hypothetical protein
MATHDYVVSNASGAAVRSDLNNALAAIATNNSNATEPATTYPFQWWADTTAGQLKLRNSSNDDWVVIQELDGTKLLKNASAAAPALAFASDLDTGIYRPSSGVLAVVSNGNPGARFAANSIVFNENGSNVDFRVEGTSEANLLFVDAGNNTVSFRDDVLINSNGALTTRKAIGKTFYSGTNTDLLVATDTGTNTGDVALESTSDTAALRVHFTFSNPNGVVGSIRTSSSSTIFSTSSDYRLKENVSLITDGIARLQQLKPSRFNFIADPDIVVDGFIAHEVQDIVPEAISGDKDAVNEKGDPEYQAIDQSKLVPLLTAALQEAIERIQALEVKITALETA